MLTIKSDDIVGRTDTYNSIIKGEQIKKPNVPASLNVLLNTLRGLSLDIIPLIKDNKRNKFNKEEIYLQEDLIELKENL